ncbi:MAG: anaerobic sulfatase-maturation protein [Opitutae bacterium]|nr:anaerobic sulfatase-maturation protein [Opitutae bacterium]
MSAEKKSQSNKVPRAFNAMAKPIGSLCNLNCTYCYYLEKSALYPGHKNWRMSDEVLETFIRDYIAAQEVDEVSFVWQGGEPSLLGLDFFKKVLQLEKKYAAGKKIENAFQTNGSLLTAEWAAFLADNNFLVGVSIDGPRECHDARRLTRAGAPSFDLVAAGIEQLKRFGAEFNTLTVVGTHNVDRAVEVYEFLREIGSGFIQFIPLVERPATMRDAPLRLSSPPNLETGELGGSEVMPWSVAPEDYGRFLCEVYDVWVRRDVGKTFVQLFDVSLCAWSGVPVPLCAFRETCGNAIVVEHNGDVFSCDHFVYPRYKLGNLLERNLAEFVDCAGQKRFGDLKRLSLPRVCRKCGVRFVCNGECPKHRFLRSPDGEPGLNYFCAGYKKFFAHIAPTMSRMKRLLEQDRAPAEICMLLAQEEGRKLF